MIQIVRSSHSVALWATNARHHSGIREPSNLDVTKLVLTGQMLPQAKIVTENSKFLWEEFTFEFITLVCIAH